MKYIISLVFVMALLPAIGADLNIGVFYLSFFRFAILLLPAVYFGKNLLLKKENVYYLKRSNRTFIAFFGIWFLYSLLCVFWVRDTSYWLHGEYFIGVGVFCILFFDMAGLKVKDFVFVLKGAMIALIVHNLLGWYEVLTHVYLFAPEERLAIMANARKYYPVTMMLNQNDLVLVLIFGVCVSFYFIVCAKSYWMKAVNVFLLFSNAGLAIATDSRAGLAGLVIAVFVLGMFICSRRQKIGGVFLVVLIAAVFIFLKPDMLFEVMDRLWGTQLFVGRDAVVDSDAVRLNLIRNGLLFLRETFGAGVGTGNTEYWMENSPVYYVRGFTNMHNWWVEILTNFGIVIFILYLIFYCCLFYSLYKRFKNAKNKDCKMISLAFMAFMAAFLVTSISSSSNWGKEWLWVLWALIIAFQGSAEDTSD